MCYPSEDLPDPFRDPTVVETDESWLAGGTTFVLIALLMSVVVFGLFAAIVLSVR